MMYTILITDDEKPSREELKYLILRAAPDVRFIEAASGAEAMKAVSRERVDIAFIDINMQDMDGITLSKEITRLHPSVHIVFATAYDTYAVKAFELNAVDYILKPFEENRIAMTMQRFLKAGIHDPKPIPAPHGKVLGKLSVWKDERILLVDLKDIVYMKSDDRSTLIRTAACDYNTKESLCHIEKRLECEPFLRVHRGFIINTEQVREIQPWFNSTYIVRMNHYPQDEIPVSRSYIRRFKDMFCL